MGREPLNEAVEKYIQEGVYPFHMPGHKQGRGIKLNHILEKDITEIPGTDYLHHPTGAIKKAQELAAQTFGADRTYFLVNGTSGGILSAIHAACNPGEKIIMARNCHQSVYNGIMTLGATPIYVMPEYIKEYGMIGGINPQNVEKILFSQEIHCVIITSPTYEGFTSDIQKIAEITHQYGAILIVDEAHGAHFPFHRIFPDSAISLGADIVVQSTHKTLPALTQSSMLHVKGKRVNISRLERMLAVFQTSSPSYVLMTGLDVCRNQLEEKKKTYFDKMILYLNDFRTKSKKFQNIELLSENIIGHYSINHMDPSKLVFYCGSSTWSGEKIQRELRETYKIQIELAELNYFLCITTVSDEKKGFMHLYSALKDLDAKIIKKTGKMNDIYDIIKIPRSIISLREASYGQSKTASLDASVGCISAAFIIPYPPGIPLVVPGEEITEEVIKKIQVYLDAEHRVVGINPQRQIEILL